MPGRVTAGQAKAGLLVLVTVLSFTQPILPSGDEGRQAISKQSVKQPDHDRRASIGGDGAKSQFLELEFLLQMQRCRP
jgi:hypothetical protein